MTDNIGPPLLRLVGITKRFSDVVANDGVSLEISRGEVHGLLGANGAGKTTLMNVVYGLLEPDDGRIELDGRPVRIRNPRDALALGIGMVHQQSILVPDMTVAENVALSSSSGGLRLCRLDAVAARLAELSERHGLAVDPSSVVETLSVAARQRVEILKLLYRGAGLLILDEPTAALAPREWGHFSSILESLAERGKAIVFVTHKLDEVADVARRCTVLRDGRVVDTVDVPRATTETLARMMLGRGFVVPRERSPLPPGDAVLRVESLTLVEGDRTVLDGIDLEVRKHEILGIAGVDGNGQSELVETLIGLRRADGVIHLNGHAVERLDPARFRLCCGGVIPDDRLRDGVAPGLPLLENLMMNDFPHVPFSRHGILDLRAAKARAGALMTEYGIRAPTVGSVMRTLSGGNQQRAVVARELQGRPSLLIAAQPTRGLDVGAAEFVRTRLLEHRERGGATLLISGDLDEILSLSDRIGVMFRGRLTRILEAGEVDRERVGLVMSRGEAMP